ncbi:uncharacterized protein FYW61_013908 [Anableps anableps]
MEGRCDGSAVAESSLPERTGSDACGRPGATDGQILQAASGAARKIPGEETEEAADQRTHGSDLQRAENSTMNPGRVFPLDGLPGSQKRSLGVSKGDSLCLEAPGSVGGDPVFLDYPGGEAAPCKHQTDLQLRPPEDQTDPERRSGESRKENICSSVLRQLLQQQKHKPGRKHKKKTLMKMARLLVIAKGWDRRENQTLSLEEESDLKEEIFTSLRRKQTSRNLSQPSDLHPNEKESGQISSESAGEETRIPPESREAAPKPTSRRRKKAAKAPKAAGKKEDPSDETSGGSGSDSTHKNKEESPQTDPTAGKDPELRFRKKTVQKRTLGPSETERLSVSPGRKRTRRMGSVTHIQPAPTAAEADTGLSSQTGSSGFAGNIAAQETQPQESKKEPREGRNPSAEQLPAALQDQTKREEKVSPSDVFLKLNPGRRGAKTTTSPTTASVWDQLPSAEASNTQHETGMKDSNMRQQRAAPNTETFPVREERSDWDVMRGTLSRKQDEDPVRSRKKPKGRGWRKKITEQTLNFQTKTKLVGEAPAHQLDFPLMVTTAASREKQPDRRREPRKRKHTEDDDASRSVEVTTPGSAGDEAGGSRKMENRELHVSDELDEGSACRKIRRSCTLGIKTSSAVEELLIRFLKGSRRRASSKRSNGKAEGIPEGAELLGKDEQLPENGTKFKPTKRGREKTVGLSADGEAVPGNDPTLPGSALGSNQQKEVKMRRKKGNGQKTEDIPASGGQTGASPEPNRMNLLQIEGTSALKEDFLGVRTKRRKTGRKRRRVLKKDMRAGPKVLDPEEERPHEGDPGAPEDEEPSSVRRGQKRKVLTIKMEDKASCLMEVEANQEPETEKSQLMSSFQGKSNATETGSHTRAGPDSRGKMNLLQMEGTPALKEDFLGANSKMAPRKMKRRPKKRRILRKHSIPEPKILESDEKHPDEGDPGAPEDGKPLSVRRGRKKTVLTIEMEDGASCFMEMEANQEPETEKSLMMSSFQDKSNETGLQKDSAGPKILDPEEELPQEGDPGAPEDEEPCKTANIRHGRKRNVLTINLEGEASVQDRSCSMASGDQTGATPELPEPNRMNLLQMEGTSGLKEDLPGANSKMAPRKMKRRPKKRRILRKHSIPEPKILESDEKHPDEGDPGAPEDGKPSIQDRSSSMESGGQTRTTPELPEPNRMNLLRIEGTSALKEDFLGVRTKRRKTGRKRRRVLKKDMRAGPKVLDPEEERPHEGDPGAPEDGEPSSVMHGWKKMVVTIEMEDGASILDKSCSMASGDQTGATPELPEPNRMNLLRIEGTPGLKEDFLGANSKMAPRKMKRRPKKRRILRKHSISEPKILDSEEKHPDEGDPGAPEDGKPLSVRRGRKKTVLTIEMEDGASCFMEMEANQEPETEKSLMMSSFQDKSNETGLQKDSAGPKILDPEEELPQEGDPGAPEDGKPSIQDRSRSMEAGGQTGATPELPEPNRMNLLQIEGTSALKEDFLGVRTKRRKTGRKRRRVLKKDMRAGPKVLDPEEERPHEGDPGAPEDGEPSSVRRGQKRKVLTIKMEDKASCLMEVEANQEPETEKSQLMSSFQGKSNATETGSHTRAGPDSRGKMNLLQMEGVPTDPNGDSAEVFSKVRGWTQRRTVQKVPRGHKVLESNEDRSSEQDTGAPDDGKICATSNISRGRKKEVLTIKWEDEKSCFMEVEANQEPGRKKPFQESVSSAATTRKRRRRSKTHWTGDRKAKRPPVRSFCDVPTISSSCDETVNVRHGNQENRMMTNVPSGPGTRRRLQKEERKNLRCSFCLRSFRHISALTLHKRLHTGRKPYGCSVCTKSFSKISQLKLHLKLHGELPATRCPCCEETFRDKAELIRHLKVHLMEVERLQTELGRSRRSRSTADQDKTFRCPVCSKEFTKKSAFENHRRIHGKRPLGCWKTFRGSGKIRGFLVSEVGDAAVVTPLFFKCPICQRIHRHWCHYVLHLQSHASRRPHSCGACRQEYGRAAGGRRHCSVCCRASGAETACRGSLQDIWKEAGASGSPSPDAELSAFPEGEGGGKLIPPASSGDSSPSVIEDLDFDILSPNSGFSDPTLNHVSRFPPEPPRLSVRSWCGRFGGAPSHWSKRGPRRPRAFRCSRCELDFHFLGSYMDHLQEHAAETPHACPSCRGTFSHEAQPESPVSSRRRQPHAVKCSTCGKLFSTARNLRKHKLLHTGGRSHSCLPCSRSFSCHSALKAHLETHRRRLSVPQPARVAEPFLFPYPCRRCSARFSSTELLEAHQVCHFIAGRKPESPPESILSFIPSLQTAAVSSSGPKRKLPVSNRKDLFRYPHPDRLYVVPAVSSEPPVVVPLQEAGESPPRSPISAELQLQLLVKSLVPEKRLAASDSSDSEGEATMRRASCAICTQSFADVSTLHEHYRNHARGM